MNIEKLKPRTAYIRYKGRKWPRIEIQYWNGRPQNFSLHADLKTAEEILKEIQRKIILGTFDITDYVPKSYYSINLVTFLEKYIKYRSREVILKRLSKRTLEADASAFKSWLKHNPADQYIDQITREQIHKHTEQLIAQISPVSINDYMRHLRTAFNWARDEGFIRINPFAGIKKLNETDPDKPDEKYLNKYWIEILRNHLAELSLKWPLDAVDLTLYTGIRRESVLLISEKSLWWAEVNGNRVPFLKVWEKGRGGQKKSRDIPLISPAMEIIRRRIAWLNDSDQVRQIIERWNYPQYFPDYYQRARDRYLFFEIKSPVTLSQFFPKTKRKIHREMIERTRRKNEDPGNIEIMPGTWHSLRHSAATYMRDSGIAQDVVQFILGHSTAEMTDYYAKITRERAVKEIQKYANYKWSK